tara:strand:- start:6038 stop:7693 length:1656 start_codon:yes stop_codon:yes gene_type:complete
MIKYLLDFERSAKLILLILVGATVASFLNTPMLLHIELENVFNSFLINDITHNVITTNLEATSTPPLFFWIKHVLITTLGFDINMLKALPALAMCGIILLTYTFIVKQTGLKSLAIIISIILATSPFFVTASKLISFDLLYILIYIATLFTFTANVYSNSYSNLATFITGILIAASFSLSGFVGTAPILLNFLLINFIRGGFFINLKFNNPIILGLGFISFIVIWVMSLAKEVGTTQALDLVFNYQFLNDFANFEFNEGATLKYITLFIIGGFPWISLLPSGIWGVLKNLPNRLHTSNLQTSLPLICLANAVMLSIYFASVEQEFYILLAIFFNFAVIIGDRINNIEIDKASLFNFVYFAFSVVIMVLFLNEFLNIELTTYKLDTTIKELLIDEHTSISAIPHNVLYTMAGCYVLGALVLFVYTVTRHSSALTASAMLATLNLLLFAFAVFPNLKNADLNQSRNMHSWLNHAIKEDTQTMLFYKVKEPIAASMVEQSFYFDDLIRANSFAKSDQVESAYLLYPKEDRRVAARLNRNNISNCRNDLCILKVK